jgi:hypothetical protein
VAGAGICVFALVVLAACSGGSGRSAVTTTSTASSASTSTRSLHSVDWKNVTVPGAVCRAPSPIPLSGGRATIPTPDGVDVGTPQVVIAEFGSVTYGDLFGSGADVAAVNIWCSNTRGTADGQLQNSWVVFSDASGTVQALGTMSPQQPSVAGTHVAYFNTGPGGIVIKPGKIIVQELSYGSRDGTCCPSGRTTTAWSYDNGSFIPTPTVEHRPREGAGPP